MNIKKLKTRLAVLKECFKDNKNPENASFWYNEIKSLQQQIKELEANKEKKNIEEQELLELIEKRSELYDIYHSIADKRTKDAKAAKKEAHEVSHILIAKARAYLNNCSIKDVKSFMRKSDSAIIWDNAYKLFGLDGVILMILYQFTPLNTPGKAYLKALELESNPDITQGKDGVFYYHVSLNKHLYIKGVNDEK